MYSVVNIYHYLRKLSPAKAREFVLNKLSEYDAEWNYILTGSFLSVTPLFMVYIFLQRYIVEGVTHSGIKG